MIPPHYDTEHATLYLGDCLDVLRQLPDGSVHAVVTDPPYALDFMGHGWDRYTPGEFQHWCEQWAAECLRVLKPGGHLLAFGGTRTFHRLAAGIEDAGFEIRDSIAWLYGSGFPKSMDVSKAIDKAAGATREVLSEGAPVKRMIPGADQNATGSWTKDNGREYVPTDTAPATDDAAAWQGWGTALKPAFEPVVVARKPLAGTVATNVLAHGTGALNIDAARVGGREAQHLNRAAFIGYGGSDPQGVVINGGRGRWPANVVLDELQAAELDQQSGISRSAAGPIAYSQQRSRRGASATVDADNDRGRREVVDQGYGDEGGASRFFYSPKAPQHERPKVDGVAHPTVKPVDLMQWLVRLVTPPGGTVLEPFAGSGTTLEAALTEGFHCIAIEREPSYLPLIEARMRRPMQGSLFDL